MDIGKEFRTSPQKEAEGVRESMGDVIFIIARAGNHQYNRLVNKLFTENKRLLDMKTQEASDLSDKLMAEVMAKHVLKGWEGTVELDGAPLPYSVANAQKLLEIKDFRAWVDEKARDFTKFKEAVEEDVLGKLIECLHWQMQWGHQIKYLEGVRDDMGIMPKAFLTRPEQHDLGNMLFSAFNTLVQQRVWHGRPTADFDRRHGRLLPPFRIRDLDERETFITTIQRLDAAYMEVVAKKNDSQTKSSLVNDGVAVDNSSRPMLSA